MNRNLYMFILITFFSSFLRYYGLAAGRRNPVIKTYPSRNYELRYI